MTIIFSTLVHLCVAGKASRSSRASGVGLPPSSSKASRLSAEKQSLTSAEKKKRKSTYS